MFLNRLPSPLSAIVSEASNRIEYHPITVEGEEENEALGGKSEYMLRKPQFVFHIPSNIPPLAPQPSVRFCHVGSLGSVGFPLAS